MDLVRKISTATIIGNMPIESWVPGRDEELFTIVGIADGIREGSSNFGDWVAFIGKFVARRNSDKREFAGSEAYIPEPLQSMLLAALKESGTVQVAVKVCAKYHERSTTKYTYYVKPLNELPESDTMKQLRSLMDKPDDTKQIS